MVTYKNGNTYTHVPSNKDNVGFDFLEQHGGDPVAFLKKLGITETEIVEGVPQETAEESAPSDKDTYLASISTTPEATA